MSTNSRSLAADHAPARKRRWPTEPSLWLPMLASLVFVAAPLTALDLSIPPFNYATRILWGNLVDVVILWLFAGALLYLLLKRASHSREVSTTEVLAHEVLPSALDQQAPESTTADLVSALEREALRVRPGAEHTSSSRGALLALTRSSAGAQSVEPPPSRSRARSIAIACTPPTRWCFAVGRSDPQPRPQCSASRRDRAFSEAMTRVRTRRPIRLAQPRRPASPSRSTRRSRARRGLPLDLVMARLEKHRTSQAGSAGSGSTIRAATLAGVRKLEAAPPRRPGGAVEEAPPPDPSVKALHGILPICARHRRLASDVGSHARLPTEVTTAVDLLFLACSSCILGVLSFSILMAATGGRRVVLTGEAGAGCAPVRSLLHRGRRRRHPAHRGCASSIPTRPIGATLRLHREQRARP
jgi:hypothetical protein